VRQELKYLNCANPDCSKEFDYREGRLFRFREFQPEGESPATGHSVRHFWLCTPCSEICTIEYSQFVGLKIRRQFATSSAREFSDFAAVV
jgi:hypothetical protein